VASPAWRWLSHCATGWASASPSRWSIPRSLMRMLGLKPKASYVLKPTMISMLGERRA
jgi:hypothetical protein